MQAVSYEFQLKAGNLLGKNTYRAFLVVNGVVGPVLLGGAVATFFTGSAFYVDKGSMTETMMPVISRWANRWHGLDALGDPWNVVLGLAVCYAFGTAWFMIVYTKNSGSVGLLAALGWCVFPFILPDCVKMALAILIGKRLPKRLIQRV